MVETLAYGSALQVVGGLCDQVRLTVKIEKRDHGTDGVPDEECWAPLAFMNVVFEVL
jgi:hypothetical protein